MANCLVPFLAVGDIWKRRRLAARDKGGASPAGEGWLLLEGTAEIFLRWRWCFFRGFLGFWRLKGESFGGCGRENIRGREFSFCRKRRASIAIVEIFLGGSTDLSVSFGFVRRIQCI